jgi:vitamin B12 transporter
VDLPPVVVSGSHIPTSAEALPAFTTVITREEIEARQPASVVELLRRTPDLHIDQPGGRGGVSSVYLRGADPNFTLVMIDGIKVNDPTNTRGGSFDLGSVAVSDVERVEIIRGPLSSVYGSDAIAGVINIVTRRPTERPSYAVEGGVGNHGYQQINASARGPILRRGKLGYAVNANYVDDGEPVEGSKFVSRGFTANLTAEPTDAISMLLTSRYADDHSESFPDDSGGPLFAELRDVDKSDAEELTVGLDFGHQLVSRWKYRIEANWYDREEQVSSPGVALGGQNVVPPFNSDSEFQRGEIVASNLISVSDALKLSAGANARFEQGTSDSVLVSGGMSFPGRFDLNRGLYGLFAEAHYTASSGLALQAGVRIDEPEDSDTEVSPSVGVLYPFNSGKTVVRANWGEGFKLPSFFALGDPRVGDPDLKPETSRSFDLSVEQSFWDDHALVSVSGFHNRFFNIIDFDEELFRLVNRSEVTTEGVALGLSLQAASSLWFDSHVTYAETDIENTTEELRNRPDWRAGVTTTWAPTPELSLALGVLHVDEVFDFSIPTGDRTLDDYQRVDLSGTWRSRAGLRLSLAVDNILDADYQEFVGFPAPGTQFRISAGVEF